MAFTPPYTPPAWLKGGHAQTIVPVYWGAPHGPRLRRERLTTPDGDFVDLDWVDAPTPTRQIVVLFHGLEGSSRSHYARALMHEVAERRWRGVVAHFRGCSGEMNLAPRFYHSGDSQEVGWILEQIRIRFPGAPLYAVGVSLGGNALLRWLGETGHAASWVRSAVAVCAPLDLAAGGHALAQSQNMIYTRHFLKSLKAKSEKKLRQFPDLFNREAMRRARTLYEFDDVVTAPVHGFLGADDYWRRASSKQILNQIRIPTLVLNSANDPFMPADALPAAREVAKEVKLEVTAEGGHVGFYAQKLRSLWLPRRVLHFAEVGE